MLSQQERRKGFKTAKKASTKKKGESRQNTRNNSTSISGRSSKSSSSKSSLINAPSKGTNSAILASNKSLTNVNPKIRRWCSLETSLDGRREDLFKKGGVPKQRSQSLESVHYRRIDLSRRAANGNKSLGSSKSRSLTGSNASGWKFQDNFYGNFNVGRRPSMAVAWGRRVYDQYEIEIETQDVHTRYMEAKKNSIDPRSLGAWDLILSPNAANHMDKVQSWDPYHEERSKALRKLDRNKLELLVDDEKDEQVSFFRKRFMRTGDYLRPRDMQFCVEKTSFSEDEIIEWFKRFKHDCPTGKLTRDHLRRLFRSAIPDGNSDRFTEYVMRLFDSDGNDYLDFKEFLLALNMAKCDSEESQLISLFKLYEIDECGYINQCDLADMIGTLNCLTNEDNDHNDNKERLMRVFGHARLTQADFIKGYRERVGILNSLDNEEQRKLDNGLVVKHASIPEQEQKLAFFITAIINKTVGIDLELDAFQEVRLGPSQKQMKTALLRFKSKRVRDEVLLRRSEALNKGLMIEEWLTNTRRKIYKKCVELAHQGFLEGVTTNKGDIVVQVKAKEASIEVVTTEAEYNALVKRVKCVVVTNRKESEQEDARGEKL